jgi:hypothetical protein
LKSLKVELEPAKNGWAEIDVTSCLHFGHACHLREQTLALFDEVMQTPGRYLWSLGDNQDNGTKNSPGASVYENTHNPKQQLILSAAMYRPLVKADKVVMFQDSNHSARIMKDVGFITSEDAMYRLLTGDALSKRDWKVVEKYAIGGFAGRDKAQAEKWIVDLAADCPDVRTRKPLWGGWQAITEVKVGSQTYTVHSMHGEGAGTASASALQAVMKQQEIAHADLFLRGHHHKRVLADADYAHFTSHGQDAEMRRIGYLTTGCMLGYHNSYGEAKGYRPTSPGMARLHLNAKEHRFRLSM